ncbi:competence/damage-inducible protein A [Oricola sp.]|uniref:competence/damage-inducible protein A n=1 Tax=Oricola sp. TaxID=1979950 RepID=UPI0025FAC1A4|nr:competence/damage-inducible protein A [Oricola sp.]MCI5076417.1 competence/damage-inducible protein A [Oricola sp.]
MTDARPDTRFPSLPADDAGDGLIITAAALVIGDEILSGRIREKNAGHLATVLTAIGIDLKEVRIVGDDEAAIIEAVNALRARHTYLFTSGGIGPTHDDITAEAVSKALGLPCEHDAAAMRLLGDHYEKRGLEFTEARKRMTRMPEGAVHIDNPVSVAPGFVIGNVHVMAGVPAVFQAMLDHVVPTLRTGRVLLSRSVPCPHGEGVIGEPLAAIQGQFPDIAIGSYPKFDAGRFWTEIVMRGADDAQLERAQEAVAQMIAGLDADTAAAS